MNVIIEQEKLQKSLKILKGATQTKALPSLTHFLIDAQSDSIELTATDSQTNILVNFSKWINYPR